MHYSCRRTCFPRKYCIICGANLESIASKLGYKLACKVVAYAFNTAIYNLTNRL